MCKHFAFSYLTTLKSSLFFPFFFFLSQERHYVLIIIYPCQFIPKQHSYRDFSLILKRGWLESIHELQPPEWPFKSWHIINVKQLFLTWNVTLVHESTKFVHGNRLAGLLKNDSAFRSFEWVCFSEYRDLSGEKLRCYGKNTGLPK